MVVTGWGLFWALGANKGQNRDQMTAVRSCRLPSAPVRCGVHAYCDHRSVEDGRKRSVRLQVPSRDDGPFRWPVVLLGCSRWEAFFCGTTVHSKLPAFGDASHPFPMALLALMASTRS